LIFSYTRAAWVSLIAAAGVWVIVKFKIKWPVIAMGVITVLLMVIWNWSLIMDQFEQNTTVSSDDLGEHVTSISNVSTDASNMERINRWKSALRMFEERPILGWGPGTYMFLYAPYQKPWEKTIISTNAGNRGNAHSEYIGPLAESGIPGLVTVLLLVITVFTYGMRVYRQTVNYNQKELVLMALLGLTTYFTHGVLNNFLDMDKASAPFWGFIALLVAQDFWNKRASISEVYL
jgi:putative inorganic carbon (HCO3(-)) transporter